MSLATPAQVARVDVESAADMLAAVLLELPGTDVFISTAAVADYRPARAAEQKIKKSAETLELAMERTTDVLATVAARADRPFVVGFAAETEAVEQQRARQAAAQESRHDRGQRGWSRQGVRLRG